MEINDEIKDNNDPMNLDKNNKRKLIESGDTGDRKKRKVDDVKLNIFSVLQAYPPSQKKNWRKSYST